ncbi:putative dehydrogenase [Paenibacillus amylolyticus]|uniref:Dehydrogenase n=1 Tax=Paenibacillus amylolyticus TaxID=1451 RepID=A0AAP5LMB3_PAEAM|nr:Gfo/Idh/MocA family oxidoreductase [Paenibacillus amylolyticus]MDR6724402.1 putative dehydrogenase [Paenibacillus amylolyticus]
MNTMRTAIIGTGKVGHFHAKAFAKLKDSEFTAVCGRNLERTQAFADQYGVKAYDNIEEMIIREKIDVVSICTPHPNHAESAVIAANLGVHILIEKPLSSSLEDADAILDAAAKAGVQVGTVSQRRFYLPCMRIKEAIDQGKIGKPVLGTVNMYGWRDQAYYESDPWRGSWDGEGGGVLVNQAPHQIDLLLWYMGEVEEVYGQWANLNHPYIEVDDTAVAVIKFKNGGLGNIVVSNSQNPALYGKVHIHGNNGATVGVQTDGGAMFIAGMSEITEPPVNDVWTVPGEEHRLEEWKQSDSDFFNQADSLYHYHQEQIEDFLNAVSNGNKPIIDGLDGRRTVEIFTAIYRSTQENRPIKFPLN